MKECKNLVVEAYGCCGKELWCQVEPTYEHHGMTEDAMMEYLLFPLQLGTGDGLVPFLDNHPLSLE